MTVSSNGRLHLIYQFIILTMLVMFIGHDELLSERKYVYLSIICIFLLAMVILSCYADLLPVQTWISRFYEATESSESKDACYKKGSTDPEPPNNSIQEKRGTQKTEPFGKPRAYKFRNWKKNSSIEENPVETSSNTFDASSIVPMNKIEGYNFGSCVSKESDITKRYYFPFRQKRLEEWVESKESRPNKIRPSETNYTNSNADSSEVSSTKNNDDPISPSSPNSGIPKSYSFPFRRKRLEHWMEIQEHQKMNLEITSSLPQWESMDYTEYDPDFRLRRSLSGSAVNTDESDLPKIDIEKDFSQSVEVAHVSSVVHPSVPTSPTNAIDKMKAGFKDYFSKMRKESFKSNIAKGESKRRAFKSFFQSKDNVSLEVFDKKKSKSSVANEYKF